jgi:transcriptional regulator NrdR family protein
MICPKCASPSKVWKSSKSKGRRKDGDTKQMLWRRRECTVCKHRWTTFEVPEAIVDKAAQMDRLMVDLLKDDTPPRGEDDN